MKKITKLILFTLSLSLITSPVFALSKEETVYSKLNTNGSLNYTIVTEHLKNDEKLDTINDISNLTDIKNTNGDEKFDKVGNKIKWNSKGKDIYYEGKTDKELPISVDISYELNNKKMKLKDMIGKSGNVKITINYKNNLKHDNLYTPFLVTTSTIIKGDNNSNINITNGKVIETGNNNVLVGLALPGMEDSLGLNTSVDLDKTVITYETKKFELNEIYMVATPKLVEKSDLDIFSNVDSLYGTLSKVSEATKKLENGSKELKTGINTYTTKMNEYNSGMNRLSSGSTTLVNGYKELSSGIATLNEKMPDLQVGTKTIVDNLTLVATSVNTISTNLDTAYQGNTAIIAALSGANSQVSADDIDNAKGILGQNITTLNNKKTLLNSEITSLTNVSANLTGDDLTQVQTIIGNLTYELNSIDTEVATLSALGTKLDGLKDYINGVKTIEGKLTEVNTGLGQINAGVKELNKNLNNEETLNNINAYSNGIAELANGISSLNNGSNKISSGLSTLDTSIKTLNGYSNELTNASKTINEGATKLNSGIEEFNTSINSVVNLVNTKAKNLEGKAKQLLKLSDEYQTFTMKENNIEGTTKFIMVVDAQK